MPSIVPLPTGDQLRQQLEEWLEEAEAVQGQHARAIIAPHAGYRWAGVGVGLGGGQDGRCPLPAGAARRCLPMPATCLLRLCCRYSGYVAAYSYNQIDPSQV